MSIRADGRTLIYTYHSKKPITDLGAFYRGINLQQKEVLEAYCSSEDGLRNLRVTQIYYSLEGERLTSFLISPADCPQR